jgi:hypothetical protein
MTLREIARTEWAMHDDMAPLVHRVRSEFLEMPGLRLTPAQAACLWALDRSMSEQILNGLASSGFLARTAGGAYLRASMA